MSDAISSHNHNEACDNDEGVTLPTEEETKFGQELCMHVSQEEGNHLDSSVGSKRSLSSQQGDASIPNTRSKIVEFLKDSNNTTAMKIKALQMFPRFPSDILQKLEQAEQRLGELTDNKSPIVTTSNTIVAPAPAVAPVASATEIPQPSTKKARFRRLSFQKRAKTKAEKAQSEAEMKAQWEAERAQWEAEMKAQLEAKEAEMKAQLEAERAQWEAKEAEMKAQLEAERAQLEAERAATSLDKNFETIDNALKEMSHFSQAHSSGIPISTAEIKQLENIRNEQEIIGSSMGEVSEMIRHLLATAPVDFANIIPVARLDCIDGLKHVAGAFEEWVTHAVILEGVDETANAKNPKGSFAKNKKQYRERVQKGAEWFRKRVHELTHSEFGHNDVEETIYFPGNGAFEVEGSHVVMLALLIEIANCVSLQDDQPSFSPGKTRVLCERVLDGTKRHERKIDVVLAKEGRFELVMFDSNMMLTMELKPISRTGKSSTSLLEEARDQSIGHLAKCVGDGLHAFGIGLSSKATGVFGNHTILFVHQLALKMKEDKTQSANLTYLQSMPLPLMSRNLMTRVIAKGGSLSREKMEEFKKQVDNIFPTQQTANEIPSGIVMLGQIMRLRRHELLGYRLKLAESVAAETIGRGTFGVILAHDAQSVMKVPHRDKCRDYTREKRALECIQQNSNDQQATFLPTLIEAKEREFLSDDGVSFVRPTLLLEPRGEPVVGRDFVGKEVILVTEHMNKALAFLHSQSIVHNDISPKNIVYVADSDRPDSQGPKYVLVDFGTSTTIPNESLRGFVGTPAYAHDDIFQKYPGATWKPNEDFDFESLRMTAAALLTRGRPTWNMHRFPRPLTSDVRKLQLQEVLNNREKNVNKVFLDHNVEWDDDKKVLASSQNSQ